MTAIMDQGRMVETAIELSCKTGVPFHPVAVKEGWLLVSDEWPEEALIAEKADE